MGDMDQTGLDARASSAGEPSPQEEGGGGYFRFVAMIATAMVVMYVFSFMKAMIHHHSIAILTSERSESRDVRVCDLQVATIEAQRREIAEMTWLIDDIERNGPAETLEAARERPVPDFEGTSARTCPPN